MESAIEAAKTETQAALDKRMNNAKENKDVQLEVRFFLEPATSYLIEFLLQGNDDCLERSQQPCQEREDQSRGPDEA